MLMLPFSLSEINVPNEDRIREMGSWSGNNLRIPMRFAIEHPAVTALFHIRKSNELKWQWISMVATHLKKNIDNYIRSATPVEQTKRMFGIVLCKCYVFVLFFSHFSFSLAFGRRCYHSVRVFQQLFVSLRLWWFLLIYIVSYYNSRIPF